MSRQKTILFYLVATALIFGACSIGHALFYQGPYGPTVEINAPDNRTLTSADLATWANINNYGQAAQNVMINLPAAAANLGFTATIATTQAANKWGFRVNPGDSIYCDGNSTAKTSCSFNGPVVGAYLCCWTYQAGVLTYTWECRSVISQVPLSSYRIYTGGNLGGEELPAWALEGQWYDVSGALTYLLPAAQLGMHATFNATSANVFSIDCNAADHFVLDGTALADGHKISSPGAAGNQVEIVCNAANTWTIRHKSGTFVDGGA